MTYAEAVARLLGLRGGERPGMRFGLDRIETLLDALGRPERRYRIVQVGGTNGKGSVAALVAGMLGAAGQRVGLYTSPHLCSFRERIRVDGEPVTEAEVVDGVDALGTVIARVGATMFEAATALALDHFANRAVDVAVLEVGLGGRLDATTVGQPEATVITRIALDHQDYLGDSLTAIAAEKAAIIRGGFAVSATQEADALTVITARARDAGVPLLVEGVDFGAKILEHGLDGQRMSIATPGLSLENAHVAMLGTFQASNAAVAAATASRLGLGEAPIQAGLARTVWPGRFQVFPGERTLVLDGAHNPDGARALAGALEDYFADRRIALVLAIYADKDVRGIVEALLPRASRVICTRSSSERAAAPAALRATIGLTSIPVAVAGTVEDALALATAGSEDVICVAGSFSLVGDVLQLRHGRADVPCAILTPAA